jgi:hypothetical protein
MWGIPRRHLHRPFYKIDSMGPDTDKQIENLVLNKENFNEFVYTPVHEAVEEIKRRRSDIKLKEKIDKFLKGDLPGNFENKIRAVFFGQLTPNFEIRRFYSLIDGIDELEPFFLEYCDDKFVTENHWKYSLGKLKFYSGRGKKGGMKIERETIINFNTSNGRRISEINTTWGQKLLDFHHEFFFETFKPLNFDQHCDISPWLIRHGGSPIEYYKSILALMFVNGILFENFMTNDEELPFTKHVFLPAFIEITREIGMKPLIVALEPTEIEGNIFWTCYPSESQKFLDKKLGKIDI